jgi:hypothetical protein
MKRFSLNLFLIFVFSISCMLPVNAQFKNFKKKLKEAAESAGKSVLGDEEENKQPSNQTPSSQPTSPGNVKGKKLTPPKVTDHLSNANSALSSNQLSNARFEIKEAMRGVELEIGYSILDAMPKTVSDLGSNLDEDVVYSTGIGFVGLVITRYYGERLEATIGDNSMMGASYSMLLNSSYASNDGNHKNVVVQDNRGVITFDGNNTYKLGIPLAQSSIFIVECKQCDGEEDLMDAANDFNLADFIDLLTDSKSDGTLEKDASASLASASSNYSSKNLQATRSDLQNSLTEIDVQIGKIILAILPQQLGGLDAVATNDEYVASAAGFAGVYIKRVYESTDRSKRIEINLINDSPMMGMVSGFLSSPLLVGMSGKKTIKIDGFKGMYEEQEGDGSKEFKINIPSNQSMLSMIFVGVDEAQVSKSANQVPVGDIFAITK